MRDKDKEDLELNEEDDFVDPTDEEIAAFEAQDEIVKPNNRAPAVVEDQEVEASEEVPVRQPVSNIDQALAARKKAEDDAFHISAGQRLASALAKAGGIDYTPDNTLADHVRKSAQIEVDNAKERPSLETADPNSSASQAYREFVRKKLGLEVPDDISADALIKLLPALKSGNSSGGANMPRFERVQLPNGTVVIKAFDPTKILEDLRTKGEGSVELGQAGFANQFRTDPFGNIIGLSPSAGGSMGAGGGSISSPGPKVVVSSQIRPASEMTPEQKNNFRPNEAQRKAMQEQVESYNKVTESVRKQLSAAQGLKNALVEGADNEQLLAFIRTQMPRLAGEVGNLNANEQAVWQGSQSAMDRIEQFFETNRSGRLTKKNIDVVKNMVQIFESNAAKALKRGREPLFSTLENEYGVPRDYIIKTRFPEAGEPDALRKKKKKVEGKTIKVRERKTGRVAELPEKEAKAVLKNPEYEEVK